MAKLIYAAITSLDGFIEDEGGAFDWAVPDAEADYARMWRALDKVVFSRTLDAVSTPRTRLERAFDAESVGRLKDTADRDISISGPGLAQHAFRAGLVDERRFGSGVVHLHHRIR